MIKINYFDERELLVRREIETKAPKGTEAKGTQVLPHVYLRFTKYSHPKYSISITKCYKSCTYTKSKRE